MSTIGLAELPSFASQAILVIESLEGGKYLPRVRINDVTMPISKDGDNGLLTFNSLREALDVLGVHNWQEKRLLQQTAYDEMIGNPTEKPTALELAI